MSHEILQRSATLRLDFFENQAALLSKLATEGQNPDALLISCSDSRVTPEALFGAAPGDLFILRNVGNIVPPYGQSDIGASAVLEYAVHHLKISHVIVCGHTDCGAMHGLDTGISLAHTPALARWIELARPAQHTVDSRQQFEDANARHRAIVERNVVLQLHHIQTYPFIRTALEDDRLELHGWVYYLAERQIRSYNPATDTFEHIAV